MTTWWAALVERDGDLAVVSNSDAVSARRALDNALWARRYPAGRTWWWRCTNDANEHLHCGDIQSRNHADGRHEHGLSVSESPAYQDLGYRYIYVVTGELVGRGSDQEPVIVRARALAAPSETPHPDWLGRDEGMSAQEYGRLYGGIHRGRYCYQWSDPIPREDAQIVVRDDEPVWHGE